ncbi:unnamed protein product [Arabis nemorensis]|uniref:Uncharacterized protein n=1 Tax=Arabis nemorensis TaxID=586526 RepID=A0A565ALP8_9BRAS|nr:unnamed protein product [Arabis nemorensis]
MASINLLLIIILVLVSHHLTSGYALSTINTASKQDDESYVMATSDNVANLAKARNLQALGADSKVIMIKAVAKLKSSRRRKSHIVETLDVPALVGIIIAAVMVTIVIIGLTISCYLRLKTKKAQSIEQEKINGSSETQSSKTENHV